MPGRITPLITEEIYHVLNRGLFVQPIFTCIRDFKRALELIRYCQNKEKPLRYSKFLQLPNHQRREILKDQTRKKEFFVEIIAFCLMSNHFHFILKQLEENGISTFMANFTNSYSRYFNVKNKRNGPLFQGRFKAIRIESNEQLIHLSRYIHLNPYSSFVVKSIPQLLSYSYSSFPEYLKESSFSLCDKKIILEQFKNIKAYKNFVLDQADYQRKLEIIKHLLLDK